MRNFIMFITAVCVLFLINITYFASSFTQRACVVERVYIKHQTFNMAAWRASINKSSEEEDMCSFCLPIQSKFV